MSQAPEERNYHVFYYLLSGADAETKAELQLMDIDSYKYLTQVSGVASRTRPTPSLLQHQMYCITSTHPVVQKGEVRLSETSLWCRIALVMRHCCHRIM